jgi:HJR/Mrr/RecB family endonuclease
MSKSKLVVQVKKSSSNVSNSAVQEVVASMKPINPVSKTMRSYLL